MATVLAMAAALLALVQVVVITGAPSCGVVDPAGCRANSDFGNIALVNLTIPEQVCMLCTTLHAHMQNHALRSLNATLLLHVNIHAQSSPRARSVTC